ncbi:MAG: hypothetical protein DRP90_05860 [Planctomycetota bacterium]|nr:MAG: hypothetical protein DRP90_05860 [Planctomycetota bacterium]
MKTSGKNRPLAVFAAAFLLSAVAVFVLVLPAKSKMADDLRVVNIKRNKLAALAGDGGRSYEDLRKLLLDRRSAVLEERSALIEALSFRIEDDFDAANHLQPEVDFPIVRNKVIAYVRDNYPGFPFDATLGFPELPHGDAAAFRDRYMRLAVCKRLLEIFGDAEIDTVLSFRHEPSVTERFEDAAMSVERKIVSVSFEGRMQAIYDALRRLSTPGKYLKVETFSIHPSRSGYSHACDLSVSMLLFAFEGGAEPVVEPPPATAKPVPSGTPAVSPLPSSAAPAPSKTKKKNPLGF